jgi:hypothetical protein
MARSPLLVGRPPTLTSARRYIFTQKDRALLRLWRSAPECVSYLASVARGEVPYEEGRFKAAREILMRTMPVITAQAIQSDATATSVSATVVVGDQKTVENAAIADVQHRLDRLGRHDAMMAEIRAGAVTDVEAIEVKEEGK